MDKKGLLPSFKKSTFTEMLKSGAVEIKVDGRFPQSLALEDLNGMINLLTHGEWQILHNNHSNSPFFTTDYPIALEETSDFRINNKIVPLTPSLAVRLKPRRNTKRGHKPFDQFQLTSVHLKQAQVQRINTQIIRSAEDVVVYQRKLPWVLKFVEKNKDYWIENIVQSYGPDISRQLHFSRQQLIPRQQKPPPNSELPGSDWFEFVPREARPAG